MSEGVREHNSIVSLWPKVHDGAWCGEYLGEDGVVFGSETWYEKTEKAKHAILIKETEEGYLTYLTPSLL